MATPTSPMGAGCASLAGMSPCACKQGDAWAMGGGVSPWALGWVRWGQELLEDAPSLPVCSADQGGLLL